MNITRFMSHTYENRFILFKDLPDGCSYVLQTNSYFQAQCTLPTKCGQTFTQVISSTWYGSSTVFCYGIGDSLPYPTPYVEVNKHDHHLPSDDWYSVNQIKIEAYDLWRPGDPCIGHRTGTQGYKLTQTILLENRKGKRILIPRIFLQRMSTYTPARLDSTAEPPNNGLDPIILHNVILGTGYCRPRVTPTSVRVHMPTIANDVHTDIYSYPIYHTYQPLKTDCVNSNHSNPPYTMPFSDTDCLSGSNLVMPNCTLTDRMTTCDPLKQVTSYAMPGSNFILTFLNHLLDFITDTIGQAFRYLVHESGDLFTSLNQHYRLGETLVAIAISCYYSNNYWSPLLTIVIQGTFIGFRRPILD